jgi:hypothetical protein
VKFGIHIGLDSQWACAATACKIAMAWLSFMAETGNVLNMIDRPTVDGLLDGHSLEKYAWSLSTNVI